MKEPHEYCLDCNYSKPVRIDVTDGQRIATCKTCGRATSVTTVDVQEAESKPLSVPPGPAAAALFAQMYKEVESQ